MVKIKIIKATRHIIGVRAPIASHLRPVVNPKITKTTIDIRERIKKSKIAVLAV